MATAPTTAAPTTAPTTVPTTETPAPAANPALPVDGTYNFRTTGGYAAEGGRTVRDGKLFRSDALHRLTDAGRTSMAELGIATVIDLRDETELATSPSAVDGLALKVAHYPIFPARRVPTSEALVSLAAVYRLIVQEHADRIAGAVRLIAASGEGPVLVHCTAGKDRTGLVIATALLAVGVDREQVLADYATSGKNLSGPWTDAMLAAVAQHVQGPMTDETRDLIVASPAPVLAEALDLIDATYGNAAGLLKAHGFGDEELARLRDVLTVPASPASQN
ncbi:tyrosine-protein phosphatase [Sinomonas albida]|uniref:tyrosine-protein phosphatase n=1 Tax=Sinomonas albida TaxID=369942 RepID=UPI0010A767CB|nr:tyrosine-protein phosphatase [Sinomonas albida]